MPWTVTCYMELGSQMVVVVAMFEQTYRFGIFQPRVHTGDDDRASIVIRSIPTRETRPGVDDYAFVQDAVDDSAKLEESVLFLIMLFITPFK